MKSHALPVYKKNRIASLLCIFETIIDIALVYNNISYDAVPGSEIRPCIKIDKPLVDYRVSGNV